MNEIIPYLILLLLTWSIIAFFTNLIRDDVK